MKSVKSFLPLSMEVKGENKSVSVGMSDRISNLTTVAILTASYHMETRVATRKDIPKIRQSFLETASAMLDHNKLTTKAFLQLRDELKCAHQPRERKDDVIDMVLSSLLDVDATEVSTMEREALSEFQEAHARYKAAAEALLPMISGIIEATTEDIEGSYHIDIKPMV